MNKLRLEYHDPQLTANTDLRYVKAQFDPAFEPPEVVKKGPHGGTLRWLSGEGKVIESFIDATTGQPTQAEIHEDQIVYAMADGTPVSPFDHTIVVDIVDNRPIEECTLGAPKATPDAYSSEVAYGTVVPREIARHIPTTRIRRPAQPF